MATPDGRRPALRLKLLGDLQVRSGDAAARALPPSRRTRALLGYLVATGAAQSRSALCDLLWDGPGDPRAALRWSLTKLRSVVDDEGLPRLAADRERVAFVAHDCEVDVVQAARLLEGRPLDDLPVDDLEDAARLLHGEFLDGLDLPACYRFQHWCMGERERYARLRRGVLQALTRRLADDPPRALPHGRALVAADPLDEAAHAALVQVLAAAGRYPDAERHYEWARDLLRREVALRDGGALDEAIRAVRRQQRHATASAPAAPADLPALVRAPAAAFDFQRSAAGVSAALHGRDAECRALEAALTVPLAAPGLLLVGEPGIGKSRLLDHLAACAVRRGWHVIQARCFEAEAVRPYGWWLDAWRDTALREVPQGLVERAAPLLGGAGGAAGRDALFDAAADVVDALAQQRALLIAVDDLQWIDAASVALLHYVARRMAASSRPVLIAAAARAGEIDDNAGAKALLQSLQRERAWQRLDVRALDEAAIRAWLGDRLGDVHDARQASGGNPLYLQELARSGSTPDESRPLDALIDARVQAFDEPARDLLGWAAAMGGPFDVERLAAAQSRPVADVLGRLAPFERHGLVHATGEGAYDFVHGLVRQAIYRAMSTPRRRAVHGQIARTLAAAAADDAWLHGSVAHHASLAGDALLAARASLAAGEHWMRVYANVEAAAGAERGLALIERLAPGAERVRLEIGLLRLRVSAAAAPGSRSLPDLAARIVAAAEAAQVLGLHAEGASAWEILAYWRQQHGDAAGARDASLTAERCTRLADEVTRCQQLANTARCLIDIDRDGVRARALLDEAAQMAEALQRPVMELEWGRGLAARADGDLAEAHAALGRAVALARAAQNHWRETECTLALATVAYERGEVDAVQGLVDAVVDAARRMGESQVPYADALAALARRRRGDADADAALDAAVRALRERDDKGHLAYVLIEAAQAALAAGDLLAAARGADEALAAAQAVRRPTLVERARALQRAASANPGARGGAPSS